MRIDFWYAAAVLLGLIILIAPAFRSPGAYYGAEIYSIALDYPKLANKAVRVEGVFVNSSEAVVIEGKISGGGKGYLVVESGGREYRIGGPLAGKEDIAAKRIIFADW